MFNLIGDIPITIIITTFIFLILQRTVLKTSIIKLIIVNRYDKIDSIDRTICN